LSQNAVAAVDPRGVRPLEWPHDIELFAVDFHCHPAITSHVLLKYPAGRLQLDSQLVESAMWHMSSKLNCRTAVPEEVEHDSADTVGSHRGREIIAECWQVIREHVSVLQAKHIASLVSGGFKQ
jgi:hypothetical protein